MFVLSASGLVVADTLVAVSGVVLWPVVTVAVLWHVLALVPSVESVLISVLWAAAVQSDLVVLVVIHMLSFSPDFLHQVSSSYPAILSRRVMPSVLVLPNN